MAKKSNTKSKTHSPTFLLRDLDNHFYNVLIECQNIPTMPNSYNKIVHEIVVQYPVKKKEIEGLYKTQADMKVAYDKLLKNRDLEIEKLNEQLKVFRAFKKVWQQLN